MRKNKWLATFVDSVLILLIFLVVSSYMNRDTLASNHMPAPDFELQDLSGEFHQLSKYKGRKVLVYFFAPWCSVCRMSSDNLNDLRESTTDQELVIMIVGLSYKNIDEVFEFARDLKFQSPVLLGTDQQILDYQIKGFPTYFVIDKDGKVTHRSVGYSTEIGLRLRT